MQRKWTILNDYYHPILYAGVYGVWKGLHYFLMQPDFPLHSVWLEVIKQMAHAYQFSSAALLTLLGFGITFSGMDTVLLSPVSGIQIVEHCLAIPATFFFVAVVLLMNDEKMMGKLFFVTGGVAAIFLLNTLRLSAFAITNLKAPEYLGVLFHKYVFVAVTYGLIFLMLKWWIDRTEQLKAT